MKAVILAGGRGTRLGQITNKIPKPMVYIGNKPVLQYQIELLKKYKITEIFIKVNYLKNIIKDYFKNGKDFGVKIKYFEKESDLNTAGIFPFLKKDLKNDFIVLYGDLFLNINLEKFIKFHKKNNSLGTLIVHPNDHPQDSDLIEVNDKNEITKWHAKPHPQNNNYKNIANAAVYILNTKLINYIPKNKPTDFGKDIFPVIINNKKIKLFAYKTNEYLQDIGKIESLQKAINDYENNLF